MQAVKMPSNTKDFKAFQEFQKYVIQKSLKLN
jgi:hypothetical protein